MEKETNGLARYLDFLPKKHKSIMRATRWNFWIFNFDPIIKVLEAVKSDISGDKENKRVRKELSEYHQNIGKDMSVGYKEKCTFMIENFSKIIQSVN